MDLAFVSVRFLFASVLVSGVCWIGVFNKYLLCVRHWETKANELQTLPTEQTCKQCLLCTWLHSKRVSDVNSFDRRHSPVR